MVNCILNKGALIFAKPLPGISMIRLRTYLLALLVFLPINGWAQKPFLEGTITYKVKLDTDDDIKTGTYIITIKGGQIRKEMRLTGLDYVIIINCRTGKVYSLQNRSGKKYAIELTIEEMLAEQDKFRGYVLTDMHRDNTQIAGYAVSWGNVRYKDGATATVAYSRDWRPAEAVTFERFPAAGFMPLDFRYKNESGISVSFEALKIDAEPVENAVFRVPDDYKIISNAEYREMNR